MDTFGQALKIREALADADPQNPEAKRDLAVSHERIGDELIALDDIDNAKISYQTAFDIREGLLAGAPDKKRGWELDLSVSYEKLGDVDFKLGDFASALGNYVKSLQIRQSLVAADQADTEAKRDVAISLAKIGDMQANLGDSGAAITAYRESLAIRERLAEADLGNGPSQADLMIILIRLGDVGDDAKERYRRALEIARRLDTEGKLAHDQKAWIDAVAARLSKL